MYIHRVLSILLVFLFIGNSYAQIYVDQREAMQSACKDKLLEEFKNTLSKDNGLIQAQLTLTAMKLASKVLKRKYKNQSTESQKTIESYVKDIIGNNTINRLNENSNIQSNVIDMFSKYSGKVKYLDANVQLDRLRWQEKMSDEDISKYMIQMETIWKGKDSFGFDEKDFSMAWYVNRAHKSVDGKDSFLISNAVKEVLANESTADKAIARNFKRAQLKLNGTLQSLKYKVFKEHKDICLNLYSSSNQSTQNTSIFENITCDKNEVNLLDDLFEKSLEDILADLDSPSFVSPDLLISQIEILTPSKKRKIQDDINKLKTDKEKVIAFHKEGLGNLKCDGYLIVDKKNQKTSLYLQDGTEVLTSPAVTGVGHMVKSSSTGRFREFNPDSVLRRWEYTKLGEEEKSKKYSKTTGAGIFYKQKVSPELRKLREYDDEFNDRVLAIYSYREKINDDKERVVYKKEEIQAVHSVPNKKWVPSTHKKRMKSFENEDPEGKRLSSGCVNLEGYTYDIMNEFMKNDCPVYILPEDSKNYFIVKNGEMNFSTGSKDRKLKKENASLKRIIDDPDNPGKTKVDIIDDPRNFNEYLYTPAQSKVTVTGHDKDKTESEVLDQIFKNKEKILVDNKESIIENDEFQDFAAITYAITEDKSKAKEIFGDLCESLNDFKNNSSDTDREKFDKAPMRERRAVIIHNYNKKFNKDLDIKEALNKANEVEFVE